VTETKFEQLDRLHKLLCGSKSERTETAECWGALLMEHKLVRNLLLTRSEGSAEDLEAAISALAVAHAQLEVPA
jgi:hypothetical protein